MERFWKALYILGQSVLNIASKHIEVTQIVKSGVPSLRIGLGKCAAECYTKTKGKYFRLGGSEYMHTVFSVAKYVLEKAGPMTTMKLQKLVYYCQAWSLAWDEVPLFEEDFEAWANGPVCPRLFEQHRGIFVLPKNFFDAVQGDEFTQDEIETIDSVLETYGDKEPQWLSDLTHSELPWKEARRGYPPGALCNKVITKESMQQYYGGL